jgi:hypothetical protein
MSAEPWSNQQAKSGQQETSAEVAAAVEMLMQEEALPNMEPAQPTTVQPYLAPEISANEQVEVVGSRLKGMLQPRAWAAGTAQALSSRAANRAMPAYLHIGRPLLIKGQQETLTSTPFTDVQTGKVRHLQPRGLLAMHRMLTYRSRLAATCHAIFQQCSLKAGQLPPAASVSADIAPVQTSTVVMPAIIVQRAIAQLPVLNVAMPQTILTIRVHGSGLDVCSSALISMRGTEGTQQTFEAVAFDNAAKQLVEQELRSGSSLATRAHGSKAELLLKFVLPTTALLLPPPEVLLMLASDFAKESVGVEWEAATAWLVGMDQALCEDVFQGLLRCGMEASIVDSKRWWPFLPFHSQRLTVVAAVAQLDGEGRGEGSAKMAGQLVLGVRLVNVARMLSLEATLELMRWVKRQDSGELERELVEDEDLALNRHLGLRAKLRQRLAQAGQRAALLWQWQWLRKLPHPAALVLVVHEHEVGQAVELAVLAARRAGVAPLLVVASASETDAAARQRVAYRAGLHGREGVGSVVFLGEGEGATALLNKVTAVIMMNSATGRNAKRSRL